MLKGSAKGVHTFRGGNERIYPVSKAGALKGSAHKFSHFVTPHPVVNDQSLTSVMTLSVIMKAKEY